MVPVADETGVVTTLYVKELAVGIDVIGKLPTYALSLVPNVPPILTVGKGELLKPWDTLVVAVATVPLRVNVEMAMSPPACALIVVSLTA
jgi:hypothetical protein